MNDLSPPPNKTPARRRNGRTDGKSGAQKAYASENDAATLNAQRHHPQRVVPLTPSKVGAGSPARTDAATAQASSKQRNRNKAKARNTPVSPELNSRGRQTPPHRSIPIPTKSATGAAFAGATFHASPAPSALPIPSFLAKSSNESPVFGNRTGIVQELSPPATDTDAHTPFRPASAPKSTESPLDFMFRAHREERERQFRDTSMGPDSSPSRLASASAVPVNGGHGSSYTPTVPSGRRAGSRYPPADFGGSDLDANSSRPLGPTFSTPYQERIKAARLGASPSQPSQLSSAQPYASTPSDDPTDALKRFLFGGGALGGASSNPGCPSTILSSASAAGETTHSTPPPAAQAGVPEQARSNNFQAMENDLRRILKLNTTKGTSPDRGFVSQ